MAKKKKKKAKKAKKVKKALFVKSMVKKEVGKLRISGEFFPALNGEMRKLLGDAVKRAKGNKRKTLRACDL